MEQAGTAPERRGTDTATPPARWQQALEALREAVVKWEQSLQEASGDG